MLNHLRLRWCIDGGKSINDLDDSVLKIDLGQLKHGIVLQSGEMVVYLEGLTFLCGYFNFNAMFMGDDVMLVLEILKKIARSRLAGH